MFEDKNRVGLFPEPLKISLFRWAGRWGPFSVKIPCGECSLTKDIILDTLKTDLKGIPLGVDIREWLSEWWRPLLYGGWHAPIVMLGNKVISQGKALNRGLFIEAVADAYAKTIVVDGNHLFGKDGCPHCSKAKNLLKKSGIKYIYHDVIKYPVDLYEMLARVKPLISKKTPVTVPQIWLNGIYVGGADQLVQYMEKEKGLLVGSG